MVDLDMSQTHALVWTRFIIMNVMKDHEKMKIMTVKFHFFRLMVVDYIKLVNLWWVVCLEEVSIGCPFPRIRNCIRLGFGYLGGGMGLMKG
jgi:hypothetical protein